jgi:hypothetical protein
MARERTTDSPLGSQDAGGSSRWEISETGLSANDGVRVVELADQLGLVSNAPPIRRNADFLLILGGARLSNLLRPQYAAELIQSSAASPRHIVLLGGSRPVMDTERDATDSYAPQADTEFDLLTQGAASAFNFDNADRDEEVHVDAESNNANWQVWRFNPESTDLGVPITAIEAPSTDPTTRRATTADSYAFFAMHLHLWPKAACLLVTSQIYVPYQHLEGVRSLAVPFDLELETVGFPPHWQAELQGMQGPVNYLQETRSTILSARRLYAEHLSRV